MSFHNLPLDPEDGFNFADLESKEILSAREARNRLDTEKTNRWLISIGLIKEVKSFSIKMSKSLGSCSLDELEYGEHKDKSLHDFVSSESIESAEAEIIGEKVGMSSSRNEELRSRLGDEARAIVEYCNGKHGQDLITDKNDNKKTPKTRQRQGQMLLESVAEAIEIMRSKGATQAEIEALLVAKMGWLLREVEPQRSI